MSNTFTWNGAREEHELYEKAYPQKKDCYGCNFKSVNVDGNHYCLLKRIDLKKDKNGNMQIKDCGGIYKKED